MTQTRQDRRVALIEDAYVRGTIGLAELETLIQAALTYDESVMARSMLALELVGYAIALKDVEC